MDDDDGRRWCDLSLELADALERAGRVPDGRRLFMQVAERAEARGLAAHVARAAVGLAGRFIWTRPADPREVPLVERALAALGEGELALRARLQARLAALQRDRARMMEHLGRCREAVELARRSGDPFALIQTLGALCFMTVTAGTTEECLALTEELAARAREHGDLDHEVHAHLGRATVLIDAGDPAGSDVELAICTRLNERLGQPLQRWFIVVCRAELALFRGQLELAEALSGEAERTGKELQRPESPYLRLVPQYLSRRDRGRLPELEEIIADAPNRMPAFALVRLLPAHLAGERGREEEARAFLDRHLESGFAEVQDSVGHRLALALLAELAFRTGHRAAAAALEALLSPEAVPHRFLSAPPTASAGATARYRGLLAATAGRWREAAERLRQAGRENRQAGAALWALRCDLDLAHVMLVGGEGEAPEAQALLDEVAREAAARGLGGLAADVERLRARVASAVTTPVPEPAAAPAAEPAFRREGPLWTIEFGGAFIKLRDGKGLRYLAQLLTQEGKEVPVVELVGTALPAGGLRELEELEEEAEEASAWHDVERESRARDERSKLARELAASAGLRAGDAREGRAGAADAAERARQSVTKAIKGAIRRIGKEHQELGRHLASTVHTGLHCQYLPDPLRPARWRVQL